MSMRPRVDHILYRIRPKDEKHPALLPVGAKAQFRREKDHIRLQFEDLGAKDRDYIVVSMTPRKEVVEAADNRK